MSRGTALSVIRTYLKAEIRDSQEINTTADAEFNYLLANKQKDLAFAYDWPFLEHKWDLACAANSRYLNIPTTDIRGLAVSINFERPVNAYRYWSSKYQEIFYGIGMDEYNLYNSDLSGNQVDPIQKWQLISNANETSNPDQIEIWPKPAGSQTIRFIGQRNVQALSSDSDKADIDDLLLAYAVAADVLTLREQPNAKIAQEKAAKRLIALRSGYPTDECPIKFGIKSTYQRDQVKLVAIA